MSFAKFYLWSSLLIWLLSGSSYAANSRCQDLLINRTISLTDEQGIELGAELKPLLQSKVFSKALLAAFAQGLGVPADQLDLALERFAHASKEQRLELLSKLILYFDERLSVVEDWTDLKNIDLMELELGHFSEYEALSRAWREWTSSPERLVVLGSFFEEQMSAFHVDSFGHNVWIDALSVRALLQRVANKPVAISTKAAGARNGFFQRLWNKLKRSPKQKEVELEPTFSSYEQEIQWLGKHIVMLQERLKYLDLRIEHEESAYLRAAHEIRMIGEETEKRHNDIHATKKLESFISPIINVIKKYKNHMTTDEYITLVKDALIAFSRSSQAYWSEPTGPAYLKFYQALHEQSGTVFIENEEQLNELLGSLRFYLYHFKYGHAELNRQLAEVLSKEWGSERPLQVNKDANSVADNLPERQRLSAERRQIARRLDQAKGRLGLLKNRSNREFSVAPLELEKKATGTTLLVSPVDQNVGSSTKESSFQTEPQRTR